MKISDAFVSFAFFWAKWVIVYLAYTMAKSFTIFCAYKTKTRLGKAWHWACCLSVGLLGGLFCGYGDHYEDPQKAVVGASVLIVAITFGILDGRDGKLTDYKDYGDDH